MPLDRIDGARIIALERDPHISKICGHVITKHAGETEQGSF
jgi:hypothetical protein